MSKTKITLPEVVSRDKWREERKELLKEEKELTRKRDRLNAKRRRLPMVEIEKDYEFEGPDLPAPRPKENEFCVYVLKCSDGSFYKGQTDNFSKRLLQHEAKQVSWTASRLPVEPIHWEIFDTREEAVEREKELKTGFGRKWLKREYEKGTLAAASRQAVK